MSAPTGNKPASASRSAGPADLVLHNGAVYTFGMTVGGWTVAVCKDRIAYIGPDAGARDWIGSRTEAINLGGKMVLPGFHDSHLHPLLGGLGLLECRLTDPSAYPAQVRAYADAHPDCAAVRGGGWLHGGFDEHGPRRELLDAVVPDRPVALKACDVHSLWCNSKALEMAGIRAETPDPPGGRIERDPQTGQPSGTLREWSAMRLVDDRLPKAGQAERLAGARAFQELAARAGLVAVHDAMVKREDLEIYAELERRGELLLRVSTSLLCEPDQGPDPLAELRALQPRYCSRRLALRAVKFFLDGVVEAHTAFLLEPYSDRPAWRGEPLWESGPYERLVSALDREGVQVHVHAIGDASVRMALDAFQHARAANGPRDTRHQIAHLDLVAPDDLPRFKQLAVVANVQPAWFYEDAGFRKNSLPFLGPDRAHQLYKLQSLIGAGAFVTCSSDWPAGGEFITLSPLEAIRIGVTRLGIADGVKEVFLPAERVALWTLLDCYTANAAFVEFLYEAAGSLEAGRLADIVVLDRNLFEVPAEEIHTAKVQLTVCEGRIAFRDPAL
ncbi:MAG: amidohydrolase family protein [Planctomycetota bacterium]|nr:amidohydrolase family protein [Planctomycetota bacterium]